MKSAFTKAIDDAVQKHSQLPNKFVDTRFVILVQLIFCLITYAAIVTAQIKVIDSCVLSLPSSFIK